MAYAMTKQGSLDNCVTYEFICDAIEDMNAIEDRYRTLGSIAIVLSGASGLEVYIAGSDKQWNSLSSIGANSSSSGSETIVIEGGGFTIHICSSSEVRFGRPKISAPDEKTIYLVPAEDTSSGNLYDEYIFVNNTWEKFGSGGNIDLSEYVTYQDLDNADYATRNDLNDYASLDDNGQVSVEQLPIPLISYHDNGKILQVASSKWTVGSLSYDFFEPKTWNGLTELYGHCIWTDGEKIYYSNVTKQYSLNKNTSTWNTKRWSGLTYFSGDDLWTDGENIYYSGGTKQYILDKSTSTWITKTWNGLTNFYSNHIWTDGENIYYSFQTTQYILDKSTSTWITKTWNGLTNFDGQYIWADGENIYYSFQTIQYVLDKTNSTWITKTWNELTEFNGHNIWTDGEDTYYSDGSLQYVLDKTTSTWQRKMWGKYSSIYGIDIWTDGDNYYYSSYLEHYTLPLKEQKLFIGTKGEFNSAINVKDIFNNCGPLENPNFTGSLSLGRKDDTVIGENSIALGFNTTASGDGAHAEGRNTIADGSYSHAEGTGLSTNKVIEGITYSNTGAWGYSAHSEGEKGYAIGEASHSEGIDTIAAGLASHAGGSHTKAIGAYSCVQGYSTIATGSCMDVSGSYNIDNGPEYTIWNNTTSYADGDLVKYSNSLYKCLHENTGYAPDIAPGYWQPQSFDQVKGLYIEIVGNGVSDASRSNARALDWNGNEYLNGDLYVGCNVNSTGGIKVATVDDIPLIETYPNNIKIKSLGNVNVNNKNGSVRDHSSFDFSKFQSGPAILTIGELTYNINGIFTSRGNGTVADSEGIDNKYISQEMNIDGSHHLVEIVQYSGEAITSIDIYTPNPSITPSSNVASLTFISDYKLTSTANAIYLNTETDGIGGEKVATEAYVNARIPTPPTTDGTYTLQVTVTDGTPTYSWISAG